MKIFVAASYSSQVNYETGEVFPRYKKWLEDILATVESLGYEVFCALKEDGYKINNADPAAAFRLDLHHIDSSDVLLALLTDKPSTGVQTEVGYAAARKKGVILAHLPEHPLAYFNSAIVKAGFAKEIELPLKAKLLEAKLQADN